MTAEIVSPRKKPGVEGRKLSPEQAAVLYNPKGEWRFAIYNDEGIIDGRLLDVSAEVAPEEAQAQLLAKVEEISAQRYVARWKQDKPHW